MSIFRRLAIIGVILLFLSVASVYADIPPEKWMLFILVNKPSTVIQGQLLECYDPLCTLNQKWQYSALQPYNRSLALRGLWCTEDKCSHGIYRQAFPYYKLILEFEDGTRASDIFARQLVPQSTYKVTILSSSLIVQGNDNTNIYLYSFLISLVLTLVVESLVASIYLRKYHLPIKALLWIASSSILSLPIIWFGFSKLPLTPNWFTSLAEAFAVLFECGFIYLMTHRAIQLKRTATLSLIMNMSSFIFGLLFWRFMWPVI